MNHWIDPSFDPMQDLHDCKQEIAELKRQQYQVHNNIMEIARAFNHQTEMIKKVLDQNKDLNDILQGRSFRS